MYPSPAIVEDLLRTALEAAAIGRAALCSALDSLPAPIYVTDAEGLITYFNPACVGFSGRVPALGKDRWCVTWKLFTDDEAFLPHDQCPMAVAIRTRRPVRGVTAIAERPDGARVCFMPFPTPVLGAAGELLGAVNMLIDVTDARQAAELRSQARRCWRLASGAIDQSTADTLNLMAAEYDAKATELEESSDHLADVLTRSA